MADRRDIAGKIQKPRLEIVVCVLCRHEGKKQTLTSFFTHIENKRSTGLVIAAITHMNGRTDG